MSSRKDGLLAERGCGGDADILKLFTVLPDTAQGNV